MLSIYIAEIGYHWLVHILVYVKIILLFLFTERILTLEILSGYLYKLAFFITDYAVLKSLLRSSDGEYVYYVLPIVCEILIILQIIVQANRIEHLVIAAAIATQCLCLIVGGSWSLESARWGVAIFGIINSTITIYTQATSPPRPWTIRTRNFIASRRAALVGSR